MFVLSANDKICQSFIMILDLSTSLFSPIRFCFVYFKTLLLSASMYFEAVLSALIFLCIFLLINFLSHKSSMSKMLFHPSIDFLNLDIVGYHFFF
jgi:hypothetical protein